MRFNHCEMCADMKRSEVMQCLAMRNNFEVLQSMNNVDSDSKNM